jgi:biopolymer transport protein ExbD
MPSVKIPRKSTATDMTPFVDVAFLILSFFMLATKFKPPEPVPISTPKSVSSELLKETNSVMVNFDSTGRVFFTMNIKNTSEDAGLKYEMIKSLSTKRNLNLSEAEMRSFQRNLAPIGVPSAG